MNIGVGSPEVERSCNEQKEGVGTTRKVKVSFENTYLDSLPSTDDTIYVHLFFRQEAAIRNLEGIIRSKLPFKIHPLGMIEEAPLNDLSDIETFAKRNGAVVDYSPAIMQGLEAYTKAEHEKRMYDECSSGD